MKEKLGDHYKKSIHYVFYELRFELLAVLLFFIGFWILSMLYLMKDQELMNQIIKSFQDSISDMSDYPPMEMVQLFLNNTRVAGMSVLIGFVPFLFLPAFILIVNGSIMGAVCAMYQLAGLNVPLLVLVGIMPHGIFELPALFISMAMGIHICLSVTRRMVESQKMKGKVVPMLKDTAVSFVLICIPLLMAAAFVEAFITGHLIDLVFTL